MTTILLVFLLFSLLQLIPLPAHTHPFSLQLSSFCHHPSWPGNVQISHSRVLSNLAYSRNCSLLANILHSKCRWHWPSGGSTACCRWRRWVLICQSVSKNVDNVIMRPCLLRHHWLTQKHSTKTSLKGKRSLHMRLLQLSASKKVIGEGLIINIFLNCTGCKCWCKCIGKLRGQFQHELCLFFFSIPLMLKQDYVVIVQQRHYDKLLFQNISKCWNTALQ